MEKPQTFAIVSDTHLTHKYSEKTFRTLKNILEESNYAIFNGDIVDLLKTKMYLFVKNEQWHELFKIMKDKKVVYIRGNHDAKEFDPNNLAEIFSEIQCDSYEMNYGTTEILHFEHGHKLIKTGLQPIGYKFPILKPIIRKIINFNGKIIDRVLRNQTYAGSGKSEKGNMFVANKMMNYSRRKSLEYLKWHLQNNIPENMWGIFAHSHGAMMDLENKTIVSGHFADAEHYGAFTFLGLEPDENNNPKFSIKGGNTKDGIIKIIQE